MLVARLQAANRASSASEDTQSLARRGDAIVESLYQLQPIKKPTLYGLVFLLDKQRANPGLVGIAPCAGRWPRNDGRGGCSAGEKLDCQYGASGSVGSIPVGTYPIGEFLGHRCAADQNLHPVIETFVDNPFYRRLKVRHGSGQQ